MHSIPLRSGAKLVLCAVNINIPIAFMICLITCAGCSTTAPELSELVQTPESFSYTGSQEMPDRWWTVFGDGELNAAIDEALHSNFTLKTAWQRLKEARAIVRRESSDLFPAIEAFLDLNKTRDDTSDTEELQIGMLAGYELDVWGRIRARVRAQESREQAGFADYQTVALTLSAEIVRTWYQLTEAYNQLDLFDEQIESNEKILQLLTTRFGQGQTRTADILRQKQLLESIRGQRIEAESRVEVLRHQLAVLLGKPPKTAVTYTRKQLPVPPPLPATGLPAELVERRPDVQTAFHLLQAADSDVAAAVRDQFPAVTLTASVYSIEDKFVEDLFENWTRSIAATVLQTVFDGGRKSAVVEQADALKMQRLYEYAQTVLDAFREVEDALILEMKQAQQIASLEKQVRLNQQTVDRLEAQYFNGSVNYIDVLLALVNEQQLRRDLLASKLTFLEYRIALYRALAGGFAPEREEEL